jgi:hypothetical protein
MRTLFLFWMRENLRFDAIGIGAAVNLACMLRIVGN